MSGRPFRARLADGTEAGFSFRRVKYLRLIVRPDCSVEVIAPERVSRREALSFANERLGWIQKHRAEMAERAESAPALREGESAPLWGRECPVHIVPGRGTAALKGVEIVLAVPEGADFAARRAALLELYRAELMRAIPPLAEKYAAALDVAVPAWSLRDMRTRLGSCTPARGTVRFALTLAAKPPVCLEYVVAHELTHLRVSGHGRDFHELLSSVCPVEAAALKLLRKHR